MRPEFDYRSPAWLTSIALVMVLVAGFAWWKVVYLSPYHTFNDMLVNNLTTSSVTKNQLTTSNDQASLQRINLQLDAQNTVRSVATVRSTAGSVTTETIGKPGVAYVRYTSIQDTNKTHDYKQVTNVWAKATGDTSGALSRLFTQSVLDVTAAPTLPVGYVEPAQRADMLAYIHDEQVFTPDYAHVKTTTVNGRKTYEYPVSVKLAPYLRLMQQFSHVYGLKDLDQVSPSDYQSAAPVKLTLSVDQTSHQMVRVTLPSSGFNETYTDYGIAKSIPLPAKTISAAELQKRLSAAK